VRSLNGAGAATCNTVSLTADVTGILPIANGSTATSTGGVTNGVGFYDGSKLTNGANLVFTNNLLGIGTSTPWAKLAVSAKSGDTNANIFLVASSTPTATSTLLAVRNNGSVNIGTSTVSDKLGIQGTGRNIWAAYGNSGAQRSYVNDNGDLYLTNGAFQAGAQVLFNSPVFAQFQDNVANVSMDFKTVAGTGDIVFTPNATDELMVSHNASVGVGTTTKVADFQATRTAANATTTIEFGKTGQTKGTGLKLYRSDGSAIYAYIAAGAAAFTLSTAACASVIGF
jgi:hypothetical protein